MIEGDIRAVSVAESLNGGQSPLTGLFGTGRSATKKGKLITYDRFIAEYWSRIEQSRFRE